MPNQRPVAAEHSKYHETLISLVPDNVLETLELQIESIPDFVNSIPSESSHVIHPPYGWTVRQVVEHCIDAERVFGYRVLRFATGEGVELPGWDQDFFSASGYGPKADLHSLADEYVATRLSNLCLIKRLTPEAWDRAGEADGNPYTVRSLIWLMAGHWIYHASVLRKRLAM